MKFFSSALFALLLSFTGLAQVDEYLSNLAEQGKFSGAVAIVDKGELQLIKGYGMANRSKSVPITENTLFTVGSITKVFTATAIMLLEEEGKLKTSDLLSAYFQNVPKDKAGITLHHLLTHGAGFPAAIGHDGDAITRDEFLKKAFAEKLLFTPGKGYQYSNVGFSLLAMIIEDVSGMTYDSYLQKNVFAPAGMTSTGYTTANKQEVVGYNTDGSEWGTIRSKNWNGTEPYWHLKGNGGVLSTAADMARWYSACAKNLILSPDQLKKQLKGYNDEGGGSYYGYGIVEFSPGKHYGHNGGNGIFRADWQWFPEAEMAVFICSADAGVPLFRISDDVIEIVMTGETPVTDEWEEVDLSAFPADQRQKVANTFLKLTRDDSREKHKVFLKAHFTEGIVERNGQDRMLDIFKMLGEEFAGKEVTGVKRSIDKVSIAFSEAGDREIIELILKFSGDKIDGLAVEVKN